MIFEYRIETHLSQSVDDAVIRDYVAVVDRVVAEELPDNVPTPAAAVADHLRSLPHGVAVAIALAREKGGEAAGVATVVVDTRPGSVGIAETKVQVDGVHRQRGVGRQLLAAAADVAATAGVMSLVGTTSDCAPAGRHFAEAVGAVPTATVLTDGMALDDGRLRTLAGFAPPPGIELTVIDGPYPPAVVGTVASLRAAEPDALGCVESTTEQTIRHLRNEEAHLFGSGLRRLATVAIGKGTVVGISEATWDPRLPAVVSQRFTGVDARWRGRGIATCVKARLLLEMPQQFPGATEVRTSTLASNTAVIRLNRKLGFRRLMTHTTWELSVLDAQFGALAAAATKG